MKRPNNQLAVLRVAKAQLGLAEEHYRSILLRVGGASSASDLDDAGFKAVMEEFHRLGFVSDARRRNLGERRDRATPGQVGLIRKLWAEVAENLSDTNLNTFISNRTGVSTLRFLDPAGAKVAITALQAWKARKGPKVA